MKTKLHYSMCNVFYGGSCDCSAYDQLRWNHILSRWEKRDTPITNATFPGKSRPFSEFDQEYADLRAEKTKRNAE